MERKSPETGRLDGRKPAGRAGCLRVAGKTQETPENDQYAGGGEQGDKTENKTGKVVSQRGGSDQISERDPNGNIGRMGNRQGISRHDD